MKIRRYKSNDLIEVIKLIKRTYKQFNSNEGTKDAVKNYMDKFLINKINLIKIKKIFDSTPISLVAIKNNKILGIICGNKNRIINLYVEKFEHKKGIGTALLNKFEKLAKNQGSINIKIRSSIYATSFYEKNGYKKTTGMRNFCGLRFQPLIKKFTNEWRR